MEWHGPREGGAGLHSSVSLSVLQFRDVSFGVPSPTLGLGTVSFKVLPCLGFPASVLRPESREHSLFLSSPLESLGEQITAVRVWGGQTLPNRPGLGTLTSGPVMGP